MTRQKAETGFGAPRERPILFSAPMVRAILEARKTQTRRVLKPWQGAEPSNKPVPDDLSCLPDFTCYRSTCPYGQPGDRLWVREAWSTHAIFDPLPPRDITARSVHYWADGDAQTGKRRPGMFMPRWASRITLEVTGVRVERLQDISEADAENEGCERNHNGYFWGGPHATGGRKQMATAAQAFRDLWKSINGSGSWDANPWVWVVAFKRIEAPQGIPGAPHGG